MTRAIVEIEMPESCVACPLECDYYCMVMRDAIDDECNIFTERDKRCPLIEIKEALSKGGDVMQETIDAYNRMYDVPQ